MPNPITRVTPNQVTGFNGNNGKFGFTISPSDTQPVSQDPANARGFDLVFVQVLAAGTLRVIDGDGHTVNYPSAVANQLIPFAVKQVTTTGTTAACVGIVP